MLPDSLLPPFIRREPRSQVLVCEWREKSLAGTHCLHMISFLRIYEISVKSAPLHYPPQGILTFHVRKMPATDNTLCGQSMMKEYKRHSALCLQKLFMRSFKLNSYGTWLTQSFSLMLTENKAMQIATVKAATFLTSNTPVWVSHGSITLQCGLSGGKQNWILCSKVVCRLLKKLGACTNNMCQGLFLLPRTRAWNN